MRARVVPESLNVKHAGTGEPHDFESSQRTQAAKLVREEKGLLAV